MVGLGGSESVNDDTMLSDLGREVTGPTSLVSLPGIS